MTPKDKALELVSKMCLNDCTDENIELAKQFALIAIDEIIKEHYPQDIKRCQYWQEVVQEIETL